MVYFKLPGSSTAGSLETATMLGLATTLLLLHQLPIVLQVVESANPNGGSAVIAEKVLSKLCFGNLFTT
jgi:hypothetical protein